MYEQALPNWPRAAWANRITRPSAGARSSRLAFCGVALVFLFFVFAAAPNGRVSKRQRQKVRLWPRSLVKEHRFLHQRCRKSPAPTIHYKTIGSLGGALTIGRPSAIELHYGRTEETIALAIDPSKPTPRGELRYNETTMLSDNPVAVWLFGTVLNYAIGIPDSMVRNLEPGDRITLSTDTGASLSFVVAETGQGQL